MSLISITALKDAQYIKDFADRLEVNLANRGEKVTRNLTVKPDILIELTSYSDDDTTLNGFLIESQSYTTLINLMAYVFVTAGAKALNTTGYAPYKGINKAKLYTIRIYLGFESNSADVAIFSNTVELVDGLTDQMYQKFSVTNQAAMPVVVLNADPYFVEDGWTCISGVGEIIDSNLNGVSIKSLFLTGESEYSSPISSQVPAAYVVAMLRPSVPDTKFKLTAGPTSETYTFNNLGWNKIYFPCGPAETVNIATLQGAGEVTGVWYAEAGVFD